MEWPRAALDVRGEAGRSISPGSPWLRLSMSSCSRLQILVIHDQDRHYAFHFVHIHAFHTPPQVLQNDRTGTAQGWKARKVTW